MSAAVTALEKAIKDEQLALGRDESSIVSLKRDLGAHEASVKTRQKNLVQLKTALDSIRLFS